MTTKFVLIVDDHVEARQMLQEAIGTLGAEVHIAAVPSGEEALLLLTTQKVDVLIVDIRLPGMSGFELIEQARKRHRDIAVILMTGLQDAQVRQQIQETPAQAYFFKPLEMDALLETIRACLAKAGADQLTEQVPTSPPQTAIEKLIHSIAQRLGAQSVALWQRDGQWIAGAGESRISPLPSSLWEGLHALWVPSNSDGEVVPTLFCCLHRPGQMDVFLSLSADHILSLEFAEGDLPRSWEAVLKKPWRDALKDLTQALHHASEGVGLQPPQGTPRLAEENVLSPEDKDFEKLFDDSAHASIRLDEAEAFWEAASQQSLYPNSEHPSPDQAGAPGFPDDGDNPILQDD